VSIIFILKKKEFRGFFVSIIYYIMPTKKMPKNAEFYTCEVCDFKCSKKSNFEKHNLTGKHAKQVKILHNTTNLEQKNADFKNYTCECGKKYKHHSSLWAHKKKGCLGKVENNEENIIVDYNLIKNKK
jgi:protein-arginine kinase activator protein McsA